MQKFSAKTLYVVLALVFVTGLAVAVARTDDFSIVTFSSTKTNPAKTSLASAKVRGLSLAIGSTEIPVEVASTDEAIKKGLSGRAELAEDSGMLFVFSTPYKYRFWMPDMHFPIDIIWIGENYEVVGVSQNISNDFDPENPVFYSPPQPTKYVLEVNAGFAAVHGVEVGDIALFRLIE